MEGVGYRRAAYAVGLRDHSDVFRAAGKLGLRELHLERKRLRDLMSYSQRDAAALDAVERGNATVGQLIRSLGMPEEMACVIIVNDASTGPEHPLAEGDRVTMLPALAGG